MKALLTAATLVIGFASSAAWSRRSVVSLPPEAPGCGRNFLTLMKGSIAMKSAQYFVLAALVALPVAGVSPSYAQMGGMEMKDMDKKPMDMKGMGADKKSGKTHKGVGTVKKIDAAASTVTIAHGPIPTMKWPAMNMTFTVKTKALLDKFAQDKKVEFEFVQQGSDYVITSAK